MTTGKHRLRVRAGAITAAIVIGIPVVGVVIFTLPVIGVALFALLVTTALMSTIHVLYELVLESITQEKPK